MPTYITTKMLKKALGNASDSTIALWVAQGILPPPVRMPRTRLWPAHEVFERIEALRDPAPAKKAA